MTSLLAETGLALYGDRWQAPLARDLGVTSRTIANWISGYTSPQRRVYVQLERLTQERAADLIQANARLNANIMPGGDDDRATAPVSKGTSQG